ncbi:hypothetical protein AB6A23_24005 [Paenibacillus tarimensis]
MLSNVANIPKPTVAETAALCVLKQSLKLPQLSANATSGNPNNINNPTVIHKGE